jgi:alpha-tubulin suppressor-like RCC1 family protein
VLAVALRCGGDITVPAEGLPNHIEIITGDQQIGVVGVALTDSLVVRITDSRDRPVQNQPVEFAPVGAGAAMALIPDTAITGSDGRAWTHWVLGTQAGAKQVQARVVGHSGSGSPLTVTFSAEARPGAPHTLSPIGGAGQTAVVGTTLDDSLLVRVVDQFNNPIANQVVSWSAEDGGSVSDVTTPTDASGRAGIRWQLGTQTGVQTSHASVTAIPGSPLDFSATAISGAAVAVKKVFGDGQTAPVGSALTDSVVVQVVDEFGNGVPGKNLSWVLGGSGGSVAPDIGTTDATGRAFTRWSLGPTAGQQTLTAAVSGFPPISFKAQALALQPARLDIVTQPQAAAASGVPLSPQPVVRLEDGLGNPVSQSNVDVTVTITSGGGALSGNTTVVTNSSGVAAFTDLTLSGSIGQRTLLFTSSGLQAIASAPINLRAGPAAALTPQGGNGQSAPVGTAVAVSPSVKVTDASGNPVPGFTVAFAIAAGGGSVTGASPVTDAGGIAAVGSWRLGPAKGNNSLTATAPGLSGSPTTFTATGLFAYNALAAGGEFSCGISTAGTPYCWGRNDRGQIGNGNLTDQISPALVAGGLEFAAIGLGKSHACGVDPSDRPFCWGENADGQLGDGTTSDRHTPNPVDGGLDFNRIYGGESHSCAVTPNGAAYCWGRNDGGQLGDGTTADRDTPVPVTGSISFASLTLGSRHTCGLSTGGIVYCWGDNGNGQLGDGTKTRHSSPVPVAGGGSWITVTVGQDFGCALRPGGNASCWGRNDKGQVGDGTTQDRTSPTPVSGGLEFTQIDAGDRHVCGIVTARTAYCWGQNNEGQLGDGTTSDRQAPIAVQGGRTFASVYAGGLHTLALDPSGVAYGWGRDANGQLGTGTGGRKLTPVLVIEP